MDFLFNSSLIMYRCRAIKDEGDNVVWHIPTPDKKPKSKSELLMQTTISWAKIKALEWEEGVKVFFILNYFKSKSLLSKLKLTTINDRKKCFLLAMLIL